MNLYRTSNGVKEMMTIVRREVVCPLGGMHVHERLARQVGKHVVLAINIQKITAVCITAVAAEYSIE